MSDVVALIVWDIPEKILRAAVREARERNCSLNDVICGALADSLGYPWKPSGRPYSREVTGQRRIIRMPRTMRELLSLQAGERSVTMRGLVISSLASHLGLEAESPKRRRSRVHGRPKGRKRAA